MIIRLLDLDASQMEAMDRLAYGYCVSEAVGCERDEMSETQLAACRALITMQLVASTAGWRGTIWFSLTLRGWTLRANGWSA